MKKITFFMFALLLTAGMTQAQESSYLYDETTQTYTYVGEPVSEFSVDFTTWQTTDLLPALAEEMELQEKDGIGIVKWKITERPCGDLGKVNTLFNNDNGDFGGAKNNVAAQKPSIYLPTTDRGVKALKMKVYCGKARAFLVNYKDDENADWKYVGGIDMPANSNEEVILPLNTVGKTTIRIEWKSTDYMAVTNIALDLEEKQPTALENVQSATLVDVYTIDGRPVRQQVAATTATHNLSAGVYIVGDRKVAVTE